MLPLGIQPLSWRPLKGDRSANTPTETDTLGPGFDSRCVILQNIQGEYDININILHSNIIVWGNEK